MRNFLVKKKPPLGETEAQALQQENLAQQVANTTQADECDNPLLRRNRPPDIAIEPIFKIAQPEILISEQDKVVQTMQEPVVKNKNGQDLVQHMTSSLVNILQGRGSLNSSLINVKDDQANREQPQQQFPLQAENLYNRQQHKGWDFVRILGKVKKFMDLMKVGRPGQSYSRVTRHHLECINDLATVVEDTQDRHSLLLVLLNIIDSFLLCFKQLPVLNPDLFLLDIWKIVTLLAIIQQIVVVPLKFGWNLTCLIFMIILLAHFCGCGFHYIGWVIPPHGQNTWLKRINLSEASTADRYVASLYFSVITMITVGYGDIVPVNNLEIIYVICMTFFCCGIFAYAVNTVGQIFQMLNQKEASLYQKKQEISLYMEKRGISVLLQGKVRKYLDYAEEKEQEAPEKGQQILNAISKKLRQDVYQEFYGQILSNVKLFKLNFSAQFLNDLALQMHEALYGPGEVIFTLDEIDDRLFIVGKGCVDCQIHVFNGGQESVLVDKKKKGDIFGETSFFTGVERNFQAVSTNIVHVVFIKQSDFLEVIKSYPKDFLPRGFQTLLRILRVDKDPNKISLNYKEKFSQIRDEIKFQQSKVNVRCHACDSKYGHSVIDCQYMHFTRDRVALIRKNNYSLVHKERLQYQRDRKRRSINCLRQNLLNRSKLKQYRKAFNAEIVRQSNIFESQIESDDEYDSLETDKQYFKRQELRYSYNQSSKQYVIDYEALEEEMAYQDISSSDSETQKFINGSKQPRKISSSSSASSSSRNSDQQLSSSSSSASDHQSSAASSPRSKVIEVNSTKPQLPDNNTSDHSKTRWTELKAQLQQSSSALPIIQDEEEEVSQKQELQATTEPKKLTKVILSPLSVKDKAKKFDFSIKKYKQVNQIIDANLQQLETDQELEGLFVQDKHLQEIKEQILKEPEITSKKKPYLIRIISPENIVQEQLESSAIIEQKDAADNQKETNETEIIQISGKPRDQMEGKFKQQIDKQSSSAHTKKQRTVVENARRSFTLQKRFSDPQSAEKEKISVLVEKKHHKLKNRAQSQVYGSGEVKKEKTSSKQEKSSSKQEKSSPKQEKSSPRKEKSSPRKEKSSPRKEKSSPRKEKSSPRKERNSSPSSTSPPTSNPKKIKNAHTSQFQYEEGQKTPPFVKRHHYKILEGLDHQKSGQIGAHESQEVKTPPVPVSQQNQLRRRESIFANIAQMSELTQIAAQRFHQNQKQGHNQERSGMAGVGRRGSVTGILVQHSNRSVIGPAIATVTPEKESQATELFFYEFDLLKSYSNYFPNNNVEPVLADYAKIVKEQRKQQLSRTLQRKKVINFQRNFRGRNSAFLLSAALLQDRTSSPEQPETQKFNARNRRLSHTSHYSDSSQMTDQNSPEKKDAQKIMASIQQQKNNQSQNQSLPVLPIVSPKFGCESSEQESDGQNKKANTKTRNSILSRTDISISQEDSRQIFVQQQPEEEDLYLDRSQVARLKGENSISFSAEN